MRENTEWGKREGKWEEKAGGRVNVRDGRKNKEKNERSEECRRDEHSEHKGKKTDGEFEKWRGAGG